MADRCFYKMLGEEFGPISLEMLREMVASGQLAGDDEVRMDTRSGWVRIATVPELNGRGGPDRFTPQKTRGLFSSINETVAGTDAVAADAGDLEAFSDLGELEIVSEMAPPVKAPAARTAPVSPPASPPARPTRPAAPPAASPAKASPGAPAASPARTAPRAAPASPPSAPVARPAAPMPAAPSAYPQAVPPGYAMPAAYVPQPVVVAAPIAAPPVAAPPPAAVDSERQWYCWTNNQQYGPVTLDTLVQWARSGRLSRSDHIKLTEEGEWLLAGSVEELFSDEASASGAAKGDAKVEIRVQSRDEYREEQERLKAEAAPAKVEEENKPAAQKFEPLMGKDFFKKQAEAKKKAAGGEIDRNKMMMIGLAIAVPVLLCIYFPPWQYLKFTALEQKLHDRLRNHYMALREFRTKNDSAGWTAYAEKASSDVKSIADSLKSTAGAAYPARQQLLYAARDHWPKMVQDSASKAGPGEEEFNKALTAARAEMRKKKK